MMNEGLLLEKVILYNKSKHENLLIPLGNPIQLDFAL